MAGGVLTASRTLLPYVSDNPQSGLFMVLWHDRYILHAKSNFTSFHPNLFAIWKMFKDICLVYSQNSKFSLFITGFISVVHEKISSL